MERIATFIHWHGCEAWVVGDAVVTWTWTNGPDKLWYREYAVVKTMAEARAWLGY